MTDIYLNKTQFNAEIDKCLNCVSKPCMKACPVSCSPQEFIQYAKNNDFDSAVKSICKNNPFAHTCGLICPDAFCMKACLRAKIDYPINIPSIQAVIINKYRKNIMLNYEPTKSGKKIAIVGAGPAGLAAAWQLLKLGYEVNIFEKRNKLGGALNLIPDARLPYSVIEDDWNYIKQFGDIEILFDSEIKNPSSLLTDGFDGVIMAVGEQVTANLGIEGEEHIIDFNQYLSNPKKYVTDGMVAVIGGGNVAADCALMAKSNGAKIVSMFIRRKIFDMKVTKKEMDALLDKQIDLVTNTRVCKVEKSGETFNLTTCSTQLNNEKYEDIKKSDVLRKGFALIVKAIGNKPEKHVDCERIIYAGDCKTGGSTIVEAVASGIDSAKLIHTKLSGEKL